MQADAPPPPPPPPAHVHVSPNMQSNPSPPAAVPQEQRPEILVPGAPALSERWLSEYIPWRSAASKKGIDALLLATMDLSAVSGGLASPKTGQYVLDLAVTANFERLGLVQGGELFASLQYWNWFGDNPTGVGDFWGWDVLNPGLGEEIFQLSECWWQQTLPDGNLSFMLGKIDANRVFAYISNAGLFLNNADSMPSTLLGFMPTYPNPALGAVAQWDGLTDDGLHGWSARAGVFDGSNAALDPFTGSNGPRTGNSSFQGIFDGHWGPFVIAEGGPVWLVDGVDWSGGLTVGGWYQPGDTQLVFGDDGAVANGAGGAYATLTHALHTPRETQGVWDVFTQVGWSSPSAVPAAFSASVGGTCTAPLPSRPNDAWGVLAAVTVFADDASVYTNANRSTGGTETVFEAFYQFVLGRGVSVQPDLQYIVTPGGGTGSGTVDDALIGTVRIQIAF